MDEQLILRTLCFLVHHIRLSATDHLRWHTEQQDLIKALNSERHRLFIAECDVVDAAKIT